MQCLIKIKISTKIITLLIINLLRKKSPVPQQDICTNRAVNFPAIPETSCRALRPDLLLPRRLLSGSSH